MICFFRDGGEDVPGCTDGEKDQSRNDYCIVDPNSSNQPSSAPSNSPSPTSVPTVSASPTQEPSMKPTGKPSVSFAPTDRPSFVPTMYPTNFPSDIPSDIPSFLPTLNPTLSFAPSSSHSPTEAPTDAPTANSREEVRLRLYWEDGYMWQESTNEKYWCMMHTYNGYPGTGKCWHGLKVEDCHQDMVYVAECNDDDRQKFNIYTMPGGSHLMIALAYHDDYRYENSRTYCLARSDFSIVIDECDMWNAKQRWWNPRGAVWQKRMELSPITYASQCATQAHHPKSGEVRFTNQYKLD